MAEFKVSSLAILGRQAQLGLAELESLYGAQHIRPLNGAALLDIQTKDINFKRLGGTIKLAQVLKILPTTSWQDILQFLSNEIPGHMPGSRLSSLSAKGGSVSRQSRDSLESSLPGMRYQPTGKFTLGLSLYGFSLPHNEQNKGLMAIKRVIRSTGKSVRIVPNKTPALNSAQVLHNKLTTRGAWELLLVRDGQRTILAQTIFVQDIEAYAARDQARPARDARVGMLPPKLAQIMINLAVGQINQKIEDGRLKTEGLLLDPFCGTGVVLQEALMMGYGAIGTDLDKRMVEFTDKNLKWLIGKNPTVSANFSVEQADATVHVWTPDFSAVVSEINLGKPLSKLPPTEELYKIAGGINDLLKKFLQNIGSQIKPGTPLCLAVPAWRAKNGFVNLPVLENLSVLGYNQLDFKHVARKDLIYFRPDQIVARRLIVLEKK